MDELESYNEIETDRELTDKEIKKTKFKFLKFLSKIYNIVIYIRSLGDRANYFRKLAEKIILIDNRTRWNSWYNIFQILLKQKAYIDKYYKDFERELQKNLLNFVDWKKFRTINDFLQPFSKATLFIEEDEIFINRTFFTIDILIKHLQILIINPLFSFLLFK
jgi:hypothetical protein